MPKKTLPPKITSLDQTKIDKVLADYRRDKPRISIANIAKNNGVSSSTVSILVSYYKMPSRRRGCKKLSEPTPKHMQILTAMCEPNATYESVGKKCGGLSRQRVHQVVRLWTSRGHKFPEKEEFKVGDEIEWNGGRYTITRLDSQSSGAVVDKDGIPTDPFKFFFDGLRAVRVS